MNKIKIKSKDITIEFDYNKLLDIIISWPIKDRIKLIEYILDCHKGNENPLRELAKSQYNNCVENSKFFDDLSKDPIFDFVSNSYSNVSKDYIKKAKCWKGFLDFFN